MKHVFYIRNNITYLISLVIIKKLQIKQEDVRVLIPRHYNYAEIPYPVYDYEDDFSKLLNPQPFLKRLLSEDSQYERFDAKINEFVENEKFAVYLPNLFSIKRQALINHKNCIQVNFIEEGMMVYSYSNSYKLGFFGNLKGKQKITAFFSRNLFYFRMRRQFAVKDFFDISVINKPKETIFYGVSKLSYQKYKPKNLEVLKLEPLRKKIFPKNSHIIVLDAMPENDIVDYPIFIESIQNLLIKLKNHSGLYIKFHPLQSEKTINDILDFCSKNEIQIIRINKEVIMEDYILASENLIFHGYISSLLFYAKALGDHKTYTYIDDFKENEKFKQFMLTQDLDLTQLLK